MKKSFLIHHDSLEVLSELTDEQAGALFKAIAYFQAHGELPECDLLTRVAITPFINQFRRDSEEYQKIVDRNKSNGKSGGRPKKEELGGSLGIAQEPKKTTGLSGFSAEPKKADSDSDSDSDNPYTHTQSREVENFESISSAEAEEPNPPFCAPPPFPGYPKPEDVPPPSNSIVTAIGARQYAAGKGMVTNEQVLEFWETWLSLNISGSKFYPNAHEIYLHFSNRCEQIWIAKQQPKPNAGPSAGSSGGSAAAPRSKGSSIEDLQRLKRRTAAAGAQQPGFTEAEIVE